MIGAAESPRAAGVLAAVEELSTGYGGRPVLEGVSFRVAAGERVAVLGPNGGGKTTLFRVLLGELPALSGRLALATRCGTVPQTERSRLDFPVSALDVALMGALARLPWWRRPGRAERRAARAALEVVGMGELARTSFGELSGGQRQRVLVARALVQDAGLLLLDEPFGGLDAPSAARLEALLARLGREGRGVLVATHDIRQARAWDLVLCLNRRMIAFGPPAQVLTRPVLDAVYGEAIVALPGGDRGILPPHHHHEHGHG
jgi:ABC-type Mn2+/Zn2+ transport system ATPase subunit